MGRTCLCCEERATEPFFRIGSAPVIANQLFSSREAAQAAAMGVIELSVCTTCGLIKNDQFDPARMTYDTSYDNALHFSDRFRQFAEELAGRLAKDYGLEGKSVAEIGCGDGYFLELLLSQGVGEGIGYDPSLSKAETRQVLPDKFVRFVPEMFGSQELPKGVGGVICRHVLEHIPDPASFLAHIRRTVEGSDAVLYFEVPNTEWLLESNSIWDVIYEHVTYWTPVSLRSALETAGFEVLKISTGFDDQYLMAEFVARPERRAEAACDPAEVGRVCDLAESFVAAGDAYLAKWEARLRALARSKRRVVIWGAGSKGVMFANLVPSAREVVDAIVDVNPRKQGHFLTGSAHPIIGPDRLVDVKPDVVLVANEIYLSEISETMSGLGLYPSYEFISGVPEA